MTWEERSPIATICGDPPTSRTDLPSMICRGLNAAFQPARLSTMRRADINQSRRLPDDYCATLRSRRDLLMDNLAIRE